MLAIVVALTLALTGSSAAASTRPGLTVTDRSPLTIRGTSFRGRERVTVEASAKRRYVRTVTATARGTFVVRFTDLKLDGCTALLLRATGSRGSAVFRKVVPMCPPPQPIDP